MLVLQNNEQSELTLPGLSLSPMIMEEVTAKYDLTLNVVEAAEGLSLLWEYSTDIFHENTITRLANHFELLLTGLVNQPDENVFLLYMLSEEGSHQQLVE